jgi:predicted TPR repeat methyltransferase
LGDSNSLKKQIDTLRSDSAQDPEFIYWDAVLAVRELRQPDAIMLLERCVALAPDAAAPHYTLAKLLAQTGDLARAAAHFELCIQAAPEHAPAWLALAQARLGLNHFERAERAFSQTLTLGSMLHGTDALIGLAHSLEAQKRWPEAIELLRPHFAHQAIDSQLIRIMVQHAPAEQTKIFLREVLQRNPAHVQAQHLLGGLDPAAQSTRASDAYVRELFDGYASRYDAHMTEHMGYVVHELLAERVRALCPLKPGQHPVNVLDLGCGTGLIGPELAGFTLTGVDLSQPMLDHAVGRNYQHLVLAEIGSFLAQCDNRQFDVIVAADTVIYFGDVREIIRQSARVLSPGGWLIFNVETPTFAAPNGYLQTPVGRYGHVPQYLLGLAREYDFINASAQAIMPRREAGAAMAGTVFAAQCGAGLIL